jgi:hypothetical protein
MKVLRNAAEQQRAVYQPMARSEAGPRPEPSQDLPSIDIDVDRAGPSRNAPLGPERIRTVRVGTGKAVAVGALAGIAAGLATWGASIYYRPGVLVVTSTPPGAAVTLDGRAVATPTPVVVEGVTFSSAHQVQASLPGHKGAGAEVRPQLGELVRRVHLQLPSALGALRVESEPPGAEVRLDGVPAGTTPLTVPGVRLDERHRVDLSLAGHELDQFVVLPEKDGDRFLRKLVPSRAGRGRE